MLYIGKNDNGEYAIKPNPIFIELEYLSYLLCSSCNDISEGLPAEIEAI